MICEKCKNTVPENFAFCPYCGQKVAAPAPVEPPVVARSAAMPKEEEYAGRYESGDMPEPVIRISKSLISQQPAPAAEAPAAPPAPPVVEKKEAPAVNRCACGAELRPDAKFCTTCGKPTQAEAPAVPPVVEKPIAPPAPPVAEKPIAPPVAEEKEAASAVNRCACGAELRPGAKFCTTCGKPTQAEAPAVPPVVEKPIAPPAPPVVEKPIAPPVVEEKEAAPAVNRCACGAELRPGAKFCTTCGKPAQAEAPKAEAPVAPPVQQPVPPVQKPIAPTQQPVAPTQQPVQKPAMKKCPLCGTVVPADAPNCTGCGVSFRPQQPTQQPAYQAAPVAPAPKAPKAKKKSAAPVIIALVAALLVIGIVVAGFMTNWFGLAGGPLETIYNAANKTLRSGGFHADFHVSVNSAVDVDGTADCVIDIEEKELTALAEATVMGQTFRIAVVDGVAVLQSDYGYQTMEIDYILDEVFDMLEEGKSYDEVLETGVEALIDGMGMDDVLDEDEAIKCVDKSLNSTSWLKKNAGYSTKSDGGVKLHVFEPKLGNLVIAAIEALEPAFEDPDELEEGLEYLEEGKSELNDMADIEVALGVQGGKLVKAEGDVTADGQTITFEITFEDIGSAKVDTDEIEDMMAEAD